MNIGSAHRDKETVDKYRTETEAKAKELRQFIETANAPIFGIDADGLVNEWNQTAETLTGFSKQEVMGKDLVQSYITDDYKESVAKVLDDALSGKETANYEFPLYSKSGDRVDVLLNSTTRRDAAGSIVGVVGVGQDITDLNKSKAQVIQASKLATLGEMSSGVAHELNQPLNVIRLALANCRHEMKNGLGNTEKILGKFDRVDGQVRRATAIIDHMRMFGRKASESFAPVNVVDVLQGALLLLREQLRLSNIKLLEQYPESGDLVVLGHEIQLEQVIINLISNAKDVLNQGAEEAQKEILLTVSENHQNVSITVQDNGGGVPSEILSRIFEPFFTTKGVGSGTGLGLSVSYGIVKDMGGELSVTNEGGGARFNIQIPRAD